MPTGPLGSAKKKEIVDMKAISRLVNLPSSKMCALWNRDTISQWAKSHDATPTPYCPSRAVEEKANQTLLPGGRCFECKKQDAGTIRRL